MDAVTRSFIGQLFLCFRLKGFHSDICDANIWMLFTCMCVNHVHIFFRKGSTFRVIPSWRQKWLKWVFGSKRCAMFWNVFSTNSVNFAVFCFWDMFDFVLKLCSGLKKKKKKKKMWGRLRPPNPRGFVDLIAHHWVTLPPRAAPPGPGRFCTESPQPTGYQVSLVCRPEYRQKTDHDLAIQRKENDIVNIKSVKTVAGFFAVWHFSVKKNC